MSKKSSAAPAPVEVEEVESAERDYTKFLEKEPTALVVHLVDWIKEQTGVEFKSKAAEEAFDLGVKLTVNLRTYHQASPENQERLETLRQEAEAAKAAKAERKAAAKVEEAPAETPAPAAKGKKGKAPAAPVVEETPAPAAAPAAKKGPRKAAGSKAPF